PLIQQLITDMLTTTSAARLLCCRAGRLRAARDPRAIMETSVAKYYASTTAFKAASDAVQIHGAVGGSSGHPVQRLMPAAKIMEIIEGSTQSQQMAIADYAFQEHAAASADRTAPVHAEPKTIKCVVWDLDDTVWHGVLLEDGAVRPRDGIVDVMAALDRRGIL